MSEMVGTEEVKSPSEKDGGASSETLTAMPLASTRRC